VGWNQFKKTQISTALLSHPPSYLLLISPQGPGWKEDRVLHSREEASALAPRVVLMVMRRRRKEMVAMGTFILKKLLQEKS
jgi:hypothetical protein